MESKNSKYYLGNLNELPTKLSFKTTNSVINIELPWDVSIQDLCQAFYTGCIGMTFTPESVANAMIEFGKEHLENMTDIDED